MMSTGSNKCIEFVCSIPRCANVFHTRLNNRVFRSGRCPDCRNDRSMLDDEKPRHVIGGELHHALRMWMLAGVDIESLVDLVKCSSDEERDNFSWWVQHLRGKRPTIVATPWVREQPMPPMGVSINPTNGRVTIIEPRRQHPLNTEFHRRLLHSHNTLPTNVPVISRHWAS